MNQQLNSPLARPKGLREVTLWMCLSALSEFLFVDGTVFGSRMADLALAVVIVALSFLTLWFFWQGRNWARILVLLLSALSVIFTIFIPAEELTLRSPAETTMYVIDLLIAGFLLYWLNTKQVKAFFNQPRVERQSGPNLPPIPEP